MWWELLRYPSDNAQAQVFWRRRMSVLAVLAVLVLLLAVLLFRGGGADSLQPTAAELPATSASAPDPAAAPAPPPSATPGPTAPASAGPSASASPAPTTAPARPAAAAPDAATNCPAGSMALRVATDAPAYPAGRQPAITLSVVDVGAQPCTVDLGTTSTAISVLSAGKPVWTSNACTDKVARATPLSPAAAQMLQLRWDRTGNAGGCAPSTPALPAGQYEIVARVGGSAAYGGNFELR